MVDMRGWSFPIGRFLGVDVRIHTFFLLLLGVVDQLRLGGRGDRRARLCAVAAAAARRRRARSSRALWAPRGIGLDLRSILLLPTGGLMSFATSEATERAADSRDAEADGRDRADCEYRVWPAAGCDGVDGRARDQPLGAALDGAVPSAAGCGVGESSARRGESAAGLAAGWRTRLSRRVRQDKAVDIKGSRTATGLGQAIAVGLHDRSAF